VGLVDGLIGNLLTALNDAGIRDQTVVLMTADHGGKGKHHGEPSMEELEIPIIVAGPGIRKAHEITAPVNTYDTAATLAKIFSVTQPEAWIGKPIKEVLIIQ